MAYFVTRHDSNLWAAFSSSGTVMFHYSPHPAALNIAPQAGLVAKQACCQRLCCPLGMGTLHHKAPGGTKFMPSEPPTGPPTLLLSSHCCCRAFLPLVLPGMLKGHQKAQASDCPIASDGARCCSNENACPTIGGGWRLA